MPLNLLSELSAHQAVSGELLAKHFGCTRAAIAKRIAALKALGVLIHAIPRAGYRYDYDYTWWSQAELASAMKAQHVGISPVVLTRVDSTNLWMREHISTAKLDYIAAAVSDFQFAGQGRRGRQWLSFPGRQITTSIGFVSPLGPISWAGVAIVVGLSLATTLRHYGWPIQLKWPNDLWLNGAKLGGILVEMDVMAEGPSRLIIGFGVNEQVCASEKIAVGRELAALQDLNIGYERHALAAALMAGVIHALKGFEQSGFEPWLARWQELDALANKSVVFDLNGHQHEGVARGINTQGALLIDTAEGLIACHSGEVSVGIAS